MKRGLKFADAAKEERLPSLQRKMKSPNKRPRSINARKRTASQIESVKKIATVLTKKRKLAVMPIRSKKESNPIVAEKEQVSSPHVQMQESNANNKTKMTRPVRSKKKSSSTRSRSADRNGKVYIILEGKSASVVDEQALMMHLFTNQSSSARYFEASEVEARVQIIKK